MRQIIFLLILSIALPLTSQAGLLERPSRNFPELSLKNYEWIIAFEKYDLTIISNEEASKIMPRESLEKYLKLKLSNLNKKIVFVESQKGDDYNYFTLTLLLYRYSGRLNIYYGLISIFADSSTSWEGQSYDEYQMVEAIAGSESQLIISIKKEIDRMAEAFADDYFYIEDLKTKKNNPTNLSQ